MIILANGRAIGPGAPVYVIAEAGVNHNGSLERARELVRVAAAAGADAVKFQTFRTEEVISRTTPLAAYQKKTGAKSQFDMVKELELKPEDFAVLRRECTTAGVDFLSTPFDFGSLRDLVELGVEAIKVPSGEVNNIPFLSAIAKTGLPVILSTGMADLEEVQRAAGLFPADSLVVLQCTTSYPAALEDVHLRAMVTMRDELDVMVGYSDHTLGIEVAVAAVALGACVLEKHFTLDQSLPGPDHAASATPQQLREMITAVRNVSIALGDGLKKPGAAELEMRKAVRKSVVATSHLGPGAILTAQDLKIKRPGTGISPEYIKILVGRQLKVAVNEDEPLKWSMLEEGENY